MTDRGWFQRVSLENITGQQTLELHNGPDSHDEEISLTEFSFSLRISLRLFQNQDLNEVLGKNLVENQEPHQKTSSKFHLKF